MLILALDPAMTQAGYAAFDPAAPGRERAMKCGSFSGDGNNAEAQCADWGRRLAEVIDRHRPDMIVFESAIRQIAAYPRKPDLVGGTRLWTPNAGQMLLPEIQGHIRQAAIDRGIPFESVAATSWRAKVYGRGGGNLDRVSAKARAKTLCRQLGIAAHNHNEAEAAMIALWAASCSPVFRALMHREVRHA